MKHPRATAWGAGVMGAAGLIGATLGPSPLVFPFVQLIAAAHVPFAYDRRLSSCGRAHSHTYEVR